MTSFFVYLLWETPLFHSSRIGAVGHVVSKKYHRHNKLMFVFMIHGVCDGQNSILEPHLDILTVFFFNLCGKLDRLDVNEYQLSLKERKPHIQETLLCFFPFYFS